jgi:hypothetical protein
MQSCEPVEMGWGDAEPFGVEGQRPMLDKMANERRRVITGMAALVASPGLAMATARRAQAQSQPDAPRSHPGRHQQGRAARAFIPNDQSERQGSRYTRL